jgi:signal transduction histidine kinase
MAGGGMDTALLKETELLRHCTDVDLADVLARSSEVRLASGELLFSDADRAQEIWVLLEGELLISKLADGDEVIIDHLQPGSYLGEISLLTAAPAEHRARATTEARLLRIPGDAFHQLVRSCESVMQTVLHTMAERVRRIERLLQQRERMAGLGTLAAGLAHELNNPAAAANRALGLLTAEFATLEPLARRLAAHPWSDDEVQLLQQLEQATSAADQASRELDPLARSDREDALARWLDGHGIERAWELAPLLTDRGVTPQQLERITAGCDASVITDALAWTERMAAIRQLLDEASQSTGRISEMVRAVKAYSYVDTSALRSADVHEGLENSLTILGHKLRQSKATVVREYDRTLPPVQSHGTELSQVWTNLLDNAADAVAPVGGTVRVRTATDGGGRVVVEVVDSGPGIPAELQTKIFEPFFTTKDAGKGTGLGLDIVKRIVTRHRGTVQVASRPGETRFTVTLPAGEPAAPVAAIGRAQGAER